jgi:AcrR family transcriptional regulator
MVENKKSSRRRTTVKPFQAKKTPLSLALADQARSQVTPLDAFKLGRKLYLEGRHISIGEMAKKLGVSRGTLYRWVGSKELLLAEIFWSMLKKAFQCAVQESPGCGIDHIVEVHRNFMSRILSFPPLQQFIQQDGTYALRILTDLSSGITQRVIAAAAEHLRDQEAKGCIRLSLPAEQVAEIFIPANQAVIYSDAISGRSPAIEKACSLIRMLLISSAVQEDPSSARKA